MFGRSSETARLSSLLTGAEGGRGRTVAITGEPGVGKSRLVAELSAQASSRRFSVVTGAFSKESAKPYEAFCRALGDDLVGGEEHVVFAQMLVIDASGLLVAKAAPQGADDVDSDIFAGMLTAVQNFVKDSFGGGEGSLGRLEYGEMKIVMEAMGPAILVAFFKGTEHPDMAPMVRSGARRLAEQHGALLASWGGRTDAVAPLQREIEKLASSKFLVRRDFSGVKLERERVRIADLILNRLLSTGGHEPTMLVLEDVHWADEGSLHALEYVARNAVSGRLLVLATSRSGENGAVDRFLEKAAAEGVLEIVQLSGITAEAVSSLLAKELSPNDFPEGFAARIAGECRGNPFFFTEVLRQMLADGSIVQKDGKFSLVASDTPLPKSVDELVQRRLDSLEPDAIALAEYASCVGREFPVAAAISMRSLKDPLLSLEKLRSSGIINVSESGEGEFAHAFYRDALYGNIVPRWRNVYHKGLGEHYEKAYDGRLDEAAYELARHFSMTAEKPKAVKYNVMAGEKAEAAYAAERALEYYRGAIQILKSGPAATDAVTQLVVLGQRVGELLALTGDYGGALSQYGDILATAEEPEARARIMRSISDIKANRGDYEAALRDLESAKKELANPQAAEMGRILNATAYVEREMGHFDKSLECDMEALELFQRLGGLEKDVSSVLNSIGSGYWRKGDFDKALEYYAKALAINERLGLERKMAAQYTNMGNIYGDRGDYVKCIESYNKALKFFQNTADVRAMAIISNNLGICYADTGEMEKAQEFYNRSIAIYKRLGDVRMLSSTYANLGIVFYYMGEVDRAIEHLLEAIDVAESRGGEAVYIAAHLTNLGVVLLERGESERARQYQERARKMASETGNKNILVAAFSGLASIELVEGNLDAARAMAGKTLELSRELGVKDSETEALSLLGTLDYRAGNLSSGRANFEAALAASEGPGFAGKQAEARMAYGKALMGCGDLVGAKEMLVKSAEQFDSVKMKGKAASAREILSHIK